jgi:hypothetical protein
VSELARDAGVDEDALYRVMRALASLGVFDERQPRTFELTLAGRMLQKGKPGVYDMGLWITSPFHFRAYAEMLHAVTTGTPAAETVTGMPVFEYFAKTREQGALRDLQQRDDRLQRRRRTGRARGLRLRQHRRPGRRGRRSRQGAHDDPPAISLECAAFCSTCRTSSRGPRRSSTRQASAIGARR